MSLKDIEKLKEKVEKDLNSKLFVPLAEEYRKEGMLEEAISVLLGGLEKQPGYMSARVSLGKIYLEKGMMDDARAQFESVINAIPDNLFAHKKLAEIYRDTGERDLAIKTFKTIIKLNPADEDAFTQLKDIESSEALLPSSGESPEEPLSEELPPVETEPDKVFGEIDLSEAGIEPVVSEEKGTEPVRADDEIAAFKDSIFGSKDGDAESIPEDLILKEEEVTAEEVIELAEEAEENIEEEFSLEDIGIGTEPGASVSEEFSELITEEIKASPVPQEMPSEAFIPDVEKQRGITIDDAEACIAKGDYFGAMNTYRKMLSSDPDNKKVLQRVEDLRGLLKLLGKDKEVLISRLNDFMEAANKRRDEFLRST